MLRPEIDFTLCQSCDPCEARKSCRTRAIMQIDRGEPPYIELDRCNSCAACIPACNWSALVMRNSSFPGIPAAGCPPFR